MYEVGSSGGGGRERNKREREKEERGRETERIERARFCDRPQRARGQRPSVRPSGGSAGGRAASVSRPSAPLSLSACGPFVRAARNFYSKAPQLTLTVGLGRDEAAPLMDPRPRCKIMRGKWRTVIT